MIGRFFKAIGRFLMGIVAIFTGSTNRAAERLEENPDAIRANFESIIADLQTQQQTLKESVSMKLQAEAGKNARMEEKMKERDEAKQLRELTHRNLQKRKAELTTAGMTKQEALAACAADQKFRDLKREYVKLKAEEQRYEDHIAEIDAELERLTDELEKYRAEFEELQAKIDGIKEEQADTISDVVLSDLDERANMLKAGMAKTDADERLENMRSMRRRKKADASAARLAAGSDAKDRRKALLAEAQALSMDDELNDDLFGDFDDEASEPAPDEKVAAPTNGVVDKGVSNQLPE